MTETFGKLGCLSLATVGSGGMGVQPLDDEAMELVTLMEVAVDFTQEEYQQLDLALRGPNKDVMLQKFWNLNSLDLPGV